MCSWNIYCCRDWFTDADCCNDTARLSTTTSAIGFPTHAAAVSNAMTLTGAGSSNSTDFPTTATGRAALPASSTTCASTRDGEECPARTTTIAVGTGVGVSLGTILMASLAALLILIRRQKNLQREVIQAHESAAREFDTSARMHQQRHLPTQTVDELEASEEPNEIGMSREWNELETSRG